MRLPTRSALRSLPVLALLILAAVTALAGCSSAGSGGTSGVRKVSAAEAVPQLASRTVIDVRTPAEYAAGHVAGAINMDVDGADFASKLAALDKSKPYALYCHSGRRSGIAADQMAKAGFKDVIDAGALESLVAAGAPVK